MTAGDRLARMFDVLDRLPGGVRRTAMLAVPLALLAVLVATLALAPTGGDDPRPRTPAGEHRSPQPRLAPPSPSPPRPASREPALSAATDPALRFLRGYLAYAYGRGRVAAIPDADPELLAALRQAQPHVPPAARTRHPRISSLQVLPQAAGTAQATATVDDGSGAQYPLVFYLDRRPGGWTVTRLGDD